ncbi:tetratricopeptide repeat protein [Pigmentiphaga aceris]|uniref:Tetratricopeptide repeat protein n=1 Tax=Pigmentiphaga aceris TaxID=1940612 RepID=A0A5C0B0G4_9BURK|nr:tetratricopeptide repeat-containing glycosyltransferase family protein [Pigmentiphaga aceris]QEI07446.1 tetratricopeptide repeat protein [Pigmentiphaga aceris]
MTSNVYAEATPCFAERASHLTAKDDAAAEQCFHEALRLAPGLPEPYVNLGILHERRQDWESAERYYRQAIDVDASCAAAHLNLGNLLVHTGRTADAEVSYFEALQCDPTEPRAWSNLGTLLSEDRRNEQATRDAEAEACYRQALSLSPTYATARFHLACLLLRQGRFQEGWQAFESRHQPDSQWRTLPLPEWRGETLTGKRVLVCCEDGYGDMIQFCRYLPWLKARGAARVTLICQPPLVRLLRTLEGVDEVFSPGNMPSTKRFDVWTLPMSLPGLFETGLESIPDVVPYLQPVTSLHDEAPEVNERRMRVGLVWQGDPRHSNDAQRSLRHLRMLSRLGDLPDIEFVSLQHGKASREIHDLPSSFTVNEELPPNADFADIAALIDDLDLVIAVDTAVAHLAGALAVPCFLLLPAHQTDWRWMKRRADTPWYPTTRLFRQPPFASWAPVVDAVFIALRDLQAAREAAAEVVTQ